MQRNSPAVLLIGNVGHHEFRDAVGWLRRSTGLATADTIDHAFDVTEGRGGGWHTVIFAQARPGQFSARDVERVSRAWPLAHYVALLGSLCEGETRSGTPWPGVARVYWHQFLARCESELRSGSPPGSWQLPRTASDAERTETMFAVAPDPRSGLIAVFTPDALLFDGLSLACRGVGYATVWCPNERRCSLRGAVAAIWDGTFQGRTDFGRLRRLPAQVAGVPVIALLAFPRHDQAREARKNGAAAIVSCPFMLPDLWNVIRATADPARSGRTGG
jgi:hypothetical protein